MGDTKNNNTVAGDKNSIYAAQGGYGPGPELADDKRSGESSMKRVAEAGVNEFSGSPTESPTDDRGKSNPSKDDPAKEE